jgi:hypothetical protein
VGFDTNSLLPTYSGRQVEGVTLSLCHSYFQSWKMTSESTNVYSAVEGWSDEDYDGVERVDHLVNGHTDANGWFSWDLPTSSFAFSDNLSFAVAMDDEYAYAEFYSHEYNDGEFAPRLDVEFAASNETPEPATAVLLAFGLGASALVGRRRKR